MKVLIVTLGCKMNQFESRAIADRVKEAGGEVVDDAEAADTVIVNTCTVTDKADRKSAQVMKRAHSAGKTVVATGCFATTDFDRLESLPYADLVVKNDRKYDIPALLVRRNSLPSGRGDFPVVTEFERTRAFLKVQDGCNQFCSYCKIPHARGRSRSLEPAAVLEHYRALLAAGYKEIVLTGINITDYHYNGVTLSALVKMILDVEGDCRVRLSSLQPDALEPAMLELLRHPRFAPHFHLSLQSGSKSVLERMERPYTPQFYLDLCEKIRAAEPGCGISTDIITGFPGETDAEFTETLELVRRARFTRVHVFPFSPRRHTKAARMTDLPDAVKKERARQLETEAGRIALDFAAERLIGKTARVLTETCREGVWTGYTGGYVAVETASGRGENEWLEFRPGRAWLDKGVLTLGD